MMGIIRALLSLHLISTENLNHRVIKHAIGVQSLSPQEEMINNCIYLKIKFT